MKKSIIKLIRPSTLNDIINCQEEIERIERETNEDITKVFQRANDSLERIKVKLDEKQIF